MATPVNSIQQTVTPGVAPKAAPAAAAAAAEPTTKVAADQWHNRARRIVSGSDGAAATLTAKQVMTDAKVGVIVSAPMEVVFNSQAYRKGELTGAKYVATIVANSLGFATWTIGGALAVSALAGFALPAWGVAVAGFAAGMIANDIWDRTFGKAITKILGDRLPEGPCKKFADVATKYFANPLYDHVWTPVKNAVMGHKVLSGVLLGGLALKFPMAAKAIGREASVWVAGTAAALGVQMGITNRILPSKEEAKPATAAAANDDDAKTLEVLQTAYKTAIDKFKSAGATAEQADASARKWMVQTLCDNGATLEDAQKIVKVAADAARKAAPKQAA